MNKIIPEISINKALLEKNLTVAVAESCTGGLVSSRLTDISGSSAYIKLNLITYSNDAKVKMLGVSPQTLEAFGAVSEEVAVQMASGIRKLAATDIGMGITGIAGPTGGTPQKPVGLVYVGITSEKGQEVYKLTIEPTLSRVEIKQMAAQRALELLLKHIEAI